MYTVCSFPKVKTIQNHIKRYIFVEIVFEELKPEKATVS
jgi:hypothetical protein